MQVADLQLDLRRGKATRAGTRLDFPAKEFSLLELLVRRKARSRVRLWEQVRGVNFDSDSNVLEIAIRRSRLKVDDPFAIKLIQTVRNVG